MKYNDYSIFQSADRILKSAYGNNAEFRDGQYEAIETTLTKKRTLIVQRTGWGKSLVYFTCTKILRQRHCGVTLVVSPLLVLMTNQLESAERIGLNCEILNSLSKDRWEEIISDLLNDKLDLVLITPETLFNEKIKSVITQINIGLFVIDEAHCISDWGHDFRLQYSKINRIISSLPQNVPLLATTATANDRVVNDLKKQLGGNVYVSRGPLSRDSLAIQVLNLPDKAMRYAWMVDHINDLPGSGIIYCITQRDCDYISDFLNKNGVSVVAYHSGLDKETVNEAEQLLTANKIKAIVATIKLGMGYDKDDIAFVIHYQTPANIVSYYQQIGRAGRNLDKAYAILMHGREDEEIQNYFINTAFPSKEETSEVISSLEKGEKSVMQLSAELNIRKNRLDKALAFLENDGCVFKERSKYYLTANSFFYDAEHYKEISDIRKKEYNQMIELTKTDKCYMRFTVNALDDYSAENCGNCANCKGHPLISEAVSANSLYKAQKYINDLIFDIEPKKRWPNSSVTKYSNIEHINKVGICLSRYGDVGYGELVKKGKYKTKRFSDELVGKSAEVLKPMIQEQHIKHITCVPSLRSDIVKDFACRLADKLKLEFIETLGKKTAAQQKEMENSAHQCANAVNSFFVIESAEIPDKIILIDDMIDSKWTITVCGNLLGEHGCNEVYPFALADSSNN